MSAGPAILAPFAAIHAGGVIAILRGAFLPQIDGIVDALIAGGIRAIEISLTSLDAADQIARASAHAAGRAAIGAGTVLTVQDVNEVFRRGASFIVSPIVEPRVIAAALECGMMPVPGAFTPTEVITAVRLGAPAVKLFPADALGPAFVRGLLTPLRDVKVVPTGGVTLQAARAYAQAGAWAVGVGGPLLAGPLDFASLSARAAQFVAAMRPSTE